MVAQGLLHFANTFAAPFAAWLTRREYKDLAMHADTGLGFTFQDALPEFIRSACILVIAYLLLRWLYYKPLEKMSVQDAPAKANLE